jgi:hypothetical protein
MECDMEDDKPSVREVIARFAPENYDGFPFADAVIQALEDAGYTIVARRVGD